MLVSEAYERIEIARDFGGVYDLRSILHQTGAHMFACRTWRFTRSMSGRATLGASSSHITLPIGCARVLSIETNGDAIDGNICIVDAATFNRHRSARTVDETNYYATEEWYTMPDGGVTRRLALHRAPGTTVTHAFRVVFEAGWTGVPSTVTGDMALPIPTYVEPFFGALLEAFTLGLEQSGLDERLAIVMSGSLYAAAIEADMRAVPNIVYPLHGWLGSIGSTVYEPEPTIDLTT